MDVNRNTTTQRADTKQKLWLRSLNSISRFGSNISQMLRLAWRAYPVGLVAIFFIDAVQGLMPLALAWITKALFDLLGIAIEGNVLDPPFLQVVPLLILQTLLTVIGQLLLQVSGYLNSELTRRLTLNVQCVLYEKINSLVGLRPFEDPNFYNTIQLASRGAQSGPQQTIRIFLVTFRSIVTFASFLGILIAFSPLLTGLLLLAVLPQLFAQLSISRQRLDIAIRNNPKERLAAYYGQLLSGIVPAKEMRLFNLADYFLGMFRHLYEDIFVAQRRQQKRELTWQISLSFLGSIAASGAFIAVILAAFAGQLSLGDVTLYVNAVRSVQDALFVLITGIGGLTESALFYNHFNNLLKLPQPLPISDKVVQPPPLRVGIELRNVSFRYSETQPWVLNGINLFIPAGRCVALVGINGAGKTTLVKLLARLYDPDEGEILWDGIDIRKFEPVELRKQIGVIFQDFIQYELSAGANIGLGNVQFLTNNDKIKHAARQAGVDDIISTLPQGYETRLSRWLADEGQGTDLSGGQWQKIALARMFMRENADLLVLDEPTSALDAQAEADIYNHFIDLMRGRTSILITHRFSTVRMADDVAVLAMGQVAEYGSHDDLLSLGGIYAKLYNLQAERYR